MITHASTRHRIARASIIEPVHAHSGTLASIRGTPRCPRQAILWASITAARAAARRSIITCRKWTIFSTLTDLIGAAKLRSAGSALMWNSRLSIGLVPPRAAKAACASFGGLELFNNLEFRLHNGYDHHLRDAITRLDRKIGLATIPKRSKNLALIIAINYPRSVAETHPVLVAESRSRVQHRRIARIC